MDATPDEVAAAYEWFCDNCDDWRTVIITATLESGGEIVCSACHWVIAAWKEPDTS